MELTDFLVNIIVPLSLFIVMAVIGMDLSITDFKRVARYPKAIIVGTVSQLALLPSLAASIIFLLSETSLSLTEQSIGALIIFAACPGGGLSNIMAAQAKGNVALSVSYTALSSMVGLVTIPLIANLGFRLFLDESAAITVPLLPMIGQLIILVFAPITFGMWFKNRFQAYVIKQEKNFNRLSNILILIVVCMSFIVENGITVDALKNALPAAIAFCTGSVVIGFIVVRLSKLNRKDSTALLIEFSVRHSGIATLVILVILKRYDLMALLSACAIIQLILVLLITAGIRLTDKNISDKPDDDLQT
jgi:BASS family bile acid:Na+ symporter